MANTIRIKRKTTTGAPANGDLVEGELAINTFDQKLYSKDATTIFELTYEHPTHPGDDAAVDTGPLTGANVISDLDFNITTDTLGHVTDANATVATRAMSINDLGGPYNNYTHPSDGGGNQTTLTGANVYSDIEINTAGHVTGTTTRAMSINDLGGPYTNNAGTVTSVGTNTGLSGTVTTSGNLSLDLPSLALGGTLVGTDWLIASNGGVQNRQVISSIPLSIFDNNSGWTSNTGTVTSVGGTAPVVSSGGTTPSISMAAATTSVNGYLTSTDWTTFNNKTSNTGTVTSVGTNTGLSGTVTTSGSLSLDLPSLALGGTLVGTDWLIASNGGVQNRQVISSIPLSIFDNNSGWTSNAGTVTSVSGTGTVSGLTLTGTVTGSGNLTLGGAITGFLTDVVGDTTPQLGGNLDMNSKYITSTYHGRVGNSSLEAQFTLASEWANLPVGYGRMARNTTGTAGGAPVNNYGYFTKSANRDGAGGWGGIWCGYTAGENYMGRTADSSTFANWDKLWSDTNLGTKAQFNTACTDGTFLFSGDVTSDTGVPAMLSSGGLPVLNTGITAAEYRTAIGAGTSSTTGTVTSVGGTGTVSGLTLTGTVTSSGNLTLGGAITGFATTSHTHTFDSLTSKTSGTGNYQTSGDIIADNFEATGLGPTTTPGASDLYMGGYGIIGDRSAQLIYVTNANSNGSSRVGLATGGSHSSAQVRLQVWIETATGRTSAGQIKDHGGTLRDIGFNVLPNFNFNANDTLEARHCGHATGKTNTSLYTLTGPTSSDVDFPVGGVAHVYNLGTSGNYLISDTGTCTMYVCDGSAAPQDIVGTCTLAPGGMATLWRYSTTAIYITGTGITV